MFPWLRLSLHSFSNEKIKVQASQSSIFGLVIRQVATRTSWRNSSYQNYACHSCNWHCKKVARARQSSSNTRTSLGVGTLGGLYKPVSRCAKEGTSFYQPELTDWWILASRLIYDFSHLYTPRAGENGFPGPSIAIIMNIKVQTLLLR